MLDRIRDRYHGEKTTLIINSTGNFLIGYLWEQSLSTLNRLPADLSERFIPKEPADFTDYSYEDRPGIHMPARIGSTLGFVQDIASIGYAASFLLGNDSKIACIAAGIVGAKLALNVVSLGAQAIYRTNIVKKKSDLEDIN